MYQANMNIEEIDGANENLPADIAVIKAGGYAEALAKVIKVSDADKRVGLVVWQGAGDIIPADIRKALKEPSKQISRRNFNIASKFNVDGGRGLSAGVVDEDLKAHFEKMNDKSARYGQVVVQDNHASALSTHVHDLCAAFNAYSPVTEYKRLDRFQTCQSQVFWHRDNHNQFNMCRVIRNIEGAGTIFMEESNIGGVGYNGALCLNNWKEATGWMLKPWDMAFMLPTVKGGIGHTWPAQELNAQLFSSSAQRHFESIDVTTAAPIFSQR
ncbi:MAG: hypothetical protein VX740_04615 [Pseudomonadota bacterium]|jgi:hypothetical protein|nr:hypothetical protein [Pseudomonadota bacterium]MED5422705.1 hypothetical protein [Pseudomonadota bacterium]